MTTVRYELFKRTGEIEVPSWDDHVLQSRESRAPLLRRLRVIGSAAFGALLLGLLLTAWYTSRHPFFSDTASATWLSWLSPLLGLLVIPPLIMLAPPAPARRKYWPLTTLPALLVVVALMAFATTGKPSVEHALALANSGATQEAMAEAKASVELGIDIAEAGALHDELQGSLVAAILEPAEVWDAVSSRHFFTPAGRERAEGHSVEVTVRRAGSLQDADDFPASEALLKLVPQRLQENEDVLALWRRLHAERVSEYWTMIQADAVDLETRLEA